MNFNFSGITYFSFAAKLPDDKEMRQHYKTVNYFNVYEKQIMQVYTIYISLLTSIVSNILL